MSTPATPDATPAEWDRDTNNLPWYRWISDAKTRFAAAKFLLQQLGREDGYGPDSQVAVEVNNGDGDKMTQVRAIFGINE